MNKPMIEAVRKHALANYSKGGWDIIIEAYEDSDLWGVIKGASTVGQAIKLAAKAVGAQNDYREDIQAEAF